MPDGPGRFIRDSSCPALLRIPLAGVDVARTGLSPSPAALSSAFRFPQRPRVAVLLPRRRLNAGGLGCSAFARHYSRNHFCFLFLRVLRCFSSPRSPPEQVRVPRLHRGGLPHSETRGSKAICASPRLIAAYRVLRRLPEPRHPPDALLLSLFFSRVLFPKLCPSCQRSLFQRPRRGSPRTGLFTSGGE